MDLIEKENFGINGNKYHIFSDPDYSNHLQNEFEPSTCRLISLFADGGVAMDIGANIGMTSILMASLFSSVYSFEPGITTFQILEKNIKQNDIHNVILENCGLGSEAKESYVSFAPNNRSGGHITDKMDLENGLTKERVIIKKGDQFTVSPSFIKIDVEGYELSVLQGLSTVLQNYKPVVFLEANHWCLNAFQRTSLPDFIDEIKAAFPIVFAVQGDIYLDLNDEAELYIFYYKNILQNCFYDVVCGFRDDQFDNFKSSLKKN